jgi:uncharacterized protein YpbB
MSKLNELIDNIMQEVEAVQVKTAAEAPATVVEKTELKTELGQTFQKLAAMCREAAATVQEPSYDDLHKFWGKK